MHHITYGRGDRPIICGRQQRLCVQLGCNSFRARDQHQDRQREGRSQREKIDALVGQEVILQVTSDMDDEIHAHTGDAGYELEVKANEPTTGTFILSAPGSFEVESHHLEKIIVILNVR